MNRGHVFLLPSFLDRKASLGCARWTAWKSAQVPFCLPQRHTLALMRCDDEEYAAAQRESQNASPVHSTHPEGTMGSPLGSMPNLPNLTEALLSHGAR